MKIKYQEGQRVRALLTIVDSGENKIGNPEAKFLDPEYIHAIKGDLGTVDCIDSDGFPTVFFDRTGTGTIVDDSEIEIVADDNNDQPFMSNLDVAQSVDLVRSAREIADDLAGEGKFDDAKVIRALVNDYIREKALPMG